MLDLQARVHLEEIEPRRIAAAFQQEFTRAGVAVAHRPRGGHRRGTHLLAHRGAKCRTRALLDRLDVGAAPSTRARTDARVPCASQRPGLDGRGRSIQPFHIQTPRHRCGLRLAAGAVNASGRFALSSRDLHAMPPPHAAGLIRTESNALPRSSERRVGLIGRRSPAQSGRRRRASVGARRSSIHFFQRRRRRQRKSGRPLAGPREVNPFERNRNQGDGIRFVTVPRR